MNAYNVIVVDDENLSRETVKLLLSRYPDWKVTGEASNGEEAVRLIEALRPDVVFLDIDMPRLSGIQLLAELKHRPIIVFITAYDSFAIKAFEENAADYILKPYTDKRFYQTLDRIKDKLVERSAVIRLQKMTSASESPKPGKDPAWKQFNIVTGKHVHMVNERDILWVEASGNYAEIHTPAGKFVYRETLANLSEQLDPDFFTRINRSFIVRNEQVKQLRKHTNGEYFVILRNDVELKLSRTYREQVSVFLNKS